MSNLVLYIAQSLDGYIAGSNDELDWLYDGQEAGSQDYGYHAFYQSIDRLIMGRRTYEVTKGFGDWPYPDKMSYVLSKSLSPVSEKNIKIISEDSIAFIKAEKAKAGTDIWLMGGGQLIKSCLNAELIDYFVIFTQPILLGAGIPLFPEGFKKQTLQLIDQRTYNSGMVQLSYEKK